MGSNLTLEQTGMNERAGRNWLWLIPAFFGLAIIGFCIYYLIHSRNELREQYLSFVHCMYREPLWELGFFNQETKDAGNIHALIGLGAGCVLIVWSWISRRRLAFSFRGAGVFAREHLMPLGALVFITIVLWTWGNAASVPAYDEVFSAVNCANVHPVQTVAFYMLPNNHILFNLINNLVFHPFYDKVFTGRIISGLCQVIFAIAVYWWLYKKLNHKGYAALYTTLLLLQFPIWGFSFQARGYAPYLLCAFVSLIATEQYLLTHGRRWLFILALTTIAGYCIMPSFMFWHFGLLLISIGWFIRERRFDMPFLKAQILAGICIYCFYLPGICYSSLANFTDNQYVKALDVPFSKFWEQFSERINATIQFSFGGDIDATNYLYTALFYAPFWITPLLVRKRAGFVLIANVCLWAAFLLLQLKFRHYPFMRNMMAHVGISFLALLLSLHFILQWVGQRVNLKLVLPVGTVLFCAVAATHFVRFMTHHVNDSLYFYDAKTGYDQPIATIAKIPVTDKVWCSDQSFYLQYLLECRGSNASHCMDAGQTYFITDRNEGIPPVPVGIVITPVDSVLQYLVYRRK
jgi:hypothetical protein